VNDKEERARFRIRKGDFEIEYEGKASEVNARYKDVMTWLRAEKTETQLAPRVDSGKVIKKAKETKQRKKTGGQKSAVISPEVDKLIDGGFFEEFRRVSDVQKELKRLTVPVSSAMAVQMALNRRVPKLLDRIQDEEGKWVYRKKK
jgi:hypothetical protein